MTSADEDFAQLAKVVRETFHAKPGVVVTPDTTAADIDGWDSLTHSVLIMRVEEEFGVELPFDRVFDLENLGALAELVRAARDTSP